MDKCEGRTVPNYAVHKLAADMLDDLGVPQTAQTMEVAMVAITKRDRELENGPIQCDHCGEYTLLCHGSAYAAKEDALRAAADDLWTVTRTATSLDELITALRPHWPADRSEALVAKLEALVIRCDDLFGAVDAEEDWPELVSARAIIDAHRRDG